MKKLTKKAIVIALIAGALVLTDGLVSDLLNQDASFTWVAFINWTVFFGATVEERLKAIIGYVIGFLAATAMIHLGNWLGFIPINIFGVAIGTALGTMIINFFCIELEAFDKKIPLSTSGMFVGMSMTFSGLGIGMDVNTLQSSITMLMIIVVYGILGLLSGWATLKFGTTKK